MTSIPLNIASALPTSAGVAHPASHIAIHFVALPSPRSASSFVQVTPRSSQDSTEPGFAEPADAQAVHCLGKVTAGPTTVSRDVVVDLMTHDPNI
jgi:hypothetical protein